MTRGKKVSDIYIYVYIYILLATGVSCEYDVYEPMLDEGRHGE